MQSETDTKSASGYPIIALLLGFEGLLCWMVLNQPLHTQIVASILGAISFFGWFGFYIVDPNEGKVMQLFGTYRGTDRIAGLRWNNPFYSATDVSLRLHNFESNRLKVNDAHGNPIEIAAVVVWRVIDTYHAIFEVDDYKDFVTIQSESALRNLAAGYAYDSNESEQDNQQPSLRGDSETIAEKMRIEVQNRLDKAGIEVIEARLSHLAYAPEIAQAMLQRQQASAILAARTTFVQGAVRMVKDAVDQLKTESNLDLDSKDKSRLACDLLLVLCGGQHVSPVLNVGTSDTNKT